MASAKVDRLLRAITTLDAALRANELVSSKKSVSIEKEKSACTDMREIMVANEFNSLQRDDRRYADVVAKVIEILFRMMEHYDQSARSYAEESLDAILRGLLLDFNYSRVVVLLITEISRNGNARSLVAAFVRLSYLLHTSKTARIVSYGVHIMAAMTNMLKRPEESVHQALIQSSGPIFEVIGPRMRDIRTEDAFELYRIAAENLDLNGSANRASVAIITHLSAYYTSIQQKAFARCLMNIRSANEKEHRSRLVGSLNAIKGIWPTVVENQKAVSEDSLKTLLCSIACCLYSIHSEVVVASIEVFDKIFSQPLEFMFSFVPTDFALRTSLEHKLIEMNKGSTPGGSPRLASKFSSLHSSPMGSVLDMSTGTSSPNPFNCPLQLPDDYKSSDSSSSSGTATPCEGQLIDPLLNADLYEEVSRLEESVASPSPMRSDTPLETEGGIPTFPPKGVCHEGSNIFVFIATVLGKRFLLAGLKGLKNDREVRISHKILALNCQTTIARHVDLSKTVVLFNDTEQSLLEVSRFVLHEDDQLCASAVQFIFTVDKWRPGFQGNLSTYERVASAFQPIRKRALLQMAIGQQHFLSRVGLLECVVKLAVSEVNSAFFLIRVTCSEFLASIRWKELSFSFRDKWQERCLQSFMHLLFATDFRVQEAAVQLVPSLVRNADLSEYCDVFSTGLPDEPLSSPAAEPIPPILNLSPSYRFRNDSIDYGIQSNLEIILSELLSYATLDLENRAASFCATLDALIVAFPPTVFSEAWGCINKVPSASSSYLSLVTDLCDSSLTSPSSLACGLRVIAALFAGHCESQMMAVVREQISVDRSTLPRLPEAPLLERIMTLILRVLNMYYSLVAENRSARHLASTSILSRPSLSPMPSKKHPSRIADISRLLGTNIHPTKQSSFLESSTIQHISTGVQGAFHNYLEGVDPNREDKFAALLKQAFCSLGTLCEMSTFPQIRPLLDEVLLYVKVLFNVCPEDSSRLLHQLFKVVFGTNAANMNLDILYSMKMKDPLPPCGDEEMYYLRYANEFSLFSAFVGRREFISNFVSRECGWLNKEMILKVHNPPTSEISPALELFEGFVTQLRHVYNSYHSVSCKRAILNVMCELPRDGIIYSMADPKKVLLDAVWQQVNDPTNGNKEMLSEIAFFLIVLSRTSVIPFEQILQGAVDLVEKANSRNSAEIMECVRVILLEALFIRKQSVPALLEVLRGRFEVVIQSAGGPALHVWTLLLHAARSDEQSWATVSLYFFTCFSDYLSSEDCRPSYSFHEVVVALSSLAPSVFRPVDGIFRLLERCFDADPSCLDAYWRRLVPLLFILLNNVSEDNLSIRLEQLLPNYATWLSSKVYGLLEDGLDKLFHTGFPKELLLMLQQTLVAVFKTENYKVFRTSLCTKLPSIVLPARVVIEHGDVLAQWLQLLRFSDEEASSRIFRDLAGQFEEDCHARRLCVLFTGELSEKAEEKQTDLLTEEVLNVSLDADHGWQTDDLCEFLQFVFKSKKNCSTPDLFSPLLKIDSQQLYYLFEVVPISHRAVFLSNLLGAMDTLLSEKSVDVLSMKSAVHQCQEILEVVADLIEIEEGSPTENVILYLTVLGKVEQMANSSHLTWRDFGTNELSTILAVLSDTLLLSTPSHDVLRGLQYVLRSATAREDFIREPFRFLTTLQSALCKICEILRKTYVLKPEKFSSPENLIFSGAEKTDLNLPSEDGNGTSGILRLLFDDVQFIINVLRSHSCDRKTPLFLFIQTLFRHPVLHSFAIVPITAMRMNWTLRVEVRLNSIVVPLVNIHLLCNLDVLNDFAWRINWLGWTTRQQFEDFWMSLFGVLSSTPTGAEITAENSADLAEQILASSCAVSSLTDLLLHTLLYPEPGNVPIGHFIIKHRENNQLFYKSKAMEHLRRIESLLLKDANANTLFSRNLERLEYKGDLYNLGQLSALSLWTLTGDLKVGQNGASSVADSSRIRVSLSEYLLKSAGELDTASSVRALFENYSHWFSRGLDYLPLPLLSATVRSMALLSDLFDETQSYEFLYVQMKNVFRGGYLADHDDLGYVVYSLLKSVTVVGIESIERTMTEADVAKQILTWIEAGLCSSFASVNEATLHGCNYLLQSMAADSLKPVYQYLSQYLLEEIDRHLDVSDPIRVSDAVASVEYFNLLWSVAFQLMEEPHQVKFKATLTQKLCEVYDTFNLPSNVLKVATAGVERLIIQSAVYSKQFLAVVLNCFKGYSTLNSLFPYALRIFVIFVFREEVDPRRCSFKPFEPHLEELLSIFRRCDVRDCEAISTVLPSILSRLYSEEQILKKLLDLCTFSQLDIPLHIKYSLKMIFDFFGRLRETQRISSIVEFLRLVLARSEKMTSTEHSRAVASCMLVAASSSNDIANRFPYYIHCLSSGVSMNEFDFLLKKAKTEIT